MAVVEDTSIGGSLSVGNDLAVGGEAAFSGTVSIDGETVVDADLRVAGDLILGTSAVGDGATATFFGDSPNSYMEWDSAQNRLWIQGQVTIVGDSTPHSISGDTTFLSGDVTLASGSLAVSNGD
eukprot:CAMPEP_0185202800 /NCGR_PEP_ID=MMETSP1140-20130426/51732_1 /TAXON_ID=298111 /ORGANISM="Pavlova sp., Strain CCMP459" /LENGTH=123 /DNA_ID=CAMNT_0027770267 /DNA_START=20 /DNA_END=388 /DNA_ORIENTATION=-